MPLAVAGRRKTASSGEIPGVVIHELLINRVDDNGDLGDRLEHLHDAAAGKHAFQAASRGLIRSALKASRLAAQQQDRTAGHWARIAAGMAKAMQTAAPMIREALAGSLFCQNRRRRR